ncbi:MAG: hypothetical protein ACE5PM_00775 [Candidatus Hydrothermarchaeales archaeon]
MRSMKSTKNWRVDDLSKPEVAIPSVYGLFLFFAFLGYRFSTSSWFLIESFGHEPALSTYLISLLAIAIFIISAKFGRNLPLMNLSSITLSLLFLITSLTLFLTFPGLGIAIFGISGGYTILIWVISTRLDEIKLITAIAVLMAILSSLTILIKGLPILNVVVRESTAVTPSRALFHGFAVFSATLLVGFYDKKRSIPTIALLVAIAILSGFKSDAIAIIVSAGVAGLLLQKIDIKEILAVGVGVLLILTVISTHIAEISYGIWKVPPLLYIFYRTGFTLSVFDEIVKLSFPFGLLHGKAFLDPTQRIISTTILNYAEPHIITSTLIGPGMVDFGILGVILTGIIVGICLGVMEKLRKNRLNTCLYAIALTHTWILIEVGLQLSSVIFYLSLLYLAMSGKAKPVVDAVPILVHDTSKAAVKG